MGRKSSMSFSEHLSELSLHKESSPFHLKKFFNVDCFFRPATSLARNVSSIIDRYRRISFSRALAVSLLTTQLRNSRNLGGSNLFTLHYRTTFVLRIFIFVLAFFIIRSGYIKRFFCCLSLSLSFLLYTKICRFY